MTENGSKWVRWRMEFIDKQIERYCIEHSSVPSKYCQRLYEDTLANVPMAVMLTGPMEASLLGFLIRSVGARRVLEIGTYTGYSALSMAEALPDDGELITLDINPESVAVGKKYWEQSPHGIKIESLIGPALEILPSLSGVFDFIFVDADKQNYPNYLEDCLERLSPQGILAFDNTLWSGKVLDRLTQDIETKAIQRVNQLVVLNPNLKCTLLPIRDGILLIQKITTI